MCHLATTGTVLRCQSLVLLNEDVLKLRKHLLFKSGSANIKYVGRADEILVDLTNRRLIGVLVTHCQIGPATLPYRLPSCRPSNLCTLVAFEVSGGDPATLDETTYQIYRI